MILKYLWSILYPEPMEKVVYIPQFHIDKHYDDMSRREKREYKRWLEKNNMWDGAIVIENLEKYRQYTENKLNIKI